MNVVNLFSKFLNKKQDVNVGYKMKIISDANNGFFSWNGQLYKSDIIRSAIRPKAKAIGKLVAKHIRDGKEGIQVNPEPYMRFLLEEPNPYMSGQMLQEKLAIQLDLNNNAFALIVNNAYGMPYQIYPVPCVSVQALHDKSGNLNLKFMLKNGKQLTYPYSNIIHLRQDYNENDIFGDPPLEVLESLMEIVNTTDQGIINAIKNSAVIRWILKFKSVLKPEDKKIEIEEFKRTFLSIDNESGAAGSDPRYDLEQVKPHDYVIPSAEQMEKTTNRIYNFFNTNEKIIQSKYNEDEWNAYYEAVLEPLATQMGGEYTRKLFTRNERSFGNKILLEASNLQYASMRTKLNLLHMVDRGAMTPNEWRKVMNMAPLPGGDEAIRRLDTAVVEGGEKEDGKEDSD